MATVISKALIFSSVFLAAFVFIHDFTRNRYYANAPQAAPRRILPEAHLIIAAMLFTGHIIRMPWYISIASAGLYLAVAYLAAPYLIPRLADRFAYEVPHEVDGDVPGEGEDGVGDDGAGN